MGLLTKQRESDRLMAEAAKEQSACDAHEAQEGAAKADRARAFEAGDADAMIAAEARQKAHNALAAKHRANLSDIGKRIAVEMEKEDAAEHDQYCEGLEKREARQAATFERDFAKAVAPLIAFLTARAGDAAEAAEANKRRAARGLPPILTADERARSTPGRVEPAVYEDRTVWRKYPGGPEVSVLTRNKSGEMVPTEAGALRSVERVCVRQERHIAPVRPKSLAETVVIPGFAAGGQTLWPAKGGR